MVRDGPVAGSPAPCWRLNTTQIEGIKTMGFDAFLKIDGIEGESTDEKHDGKEL